VEIVAGVLPQPPPGGTSPGGVGIARVLTILAGENPARQGEIGRLDHAIALDDWTQGLLEVALQGVVVVLSQLVQVQAELPTDRPRLVESLRAEVGCPQQTHLSRVDEFRERLQRLFHRHLKIVVRVAVGGVEEVTAGGDVLV
jgi:hypothetical protein